MSTNVSNRNKLAGMGALASGDRVAFRVWAPNAEKVFVTGTFNDWSADHDQMESEDHGHWYLEIENASIGDEYKYVIRREGQTLQRVDPQAREVTNSVGNGIITSRDFDWGDDDFEMHDWNKLVIYELHVGTFSREDANQVGSFADLENKLGYLQSLGINAIQIMPTSEFAGDISWGYNPAHIFAVESAYGGPDALKQLVKKAHQHGIAVILDVVYNHFGPSDLDLWQFDGWRENGKGGIYFYNDYRSTTPWGETRPDYGRGEVRQFIRDNALMWIEEFRMDGLRYDMTLYIRTIDGAGHRSIPEGWSLAQWINRDIDSKYPKKITIAEDLRSNPAITRPASFGGGNFSTQWDEGFVHPIREVVSMADDSHRDMNVVRDAICHRYNNDAFERVIYSESHDEVANGKSRVPSEIDSGNPDSLYARKRSMLAAAIVFTSPGIPMIFQGQEFLRDGWFDDTNPIDWNEAFDNDEVIQFYRDLIRLRLNSRGNTRGLMGQHVDVRHVNNQSKVISFHRWSEGGPGDDCIVLANFANREFEFYEVGVPCPGSWHIRLDGGSDVYGHPENEGTTGVVEAYEKAIDGYSFAINVRLQPYACLILSQEAK